MRTWTSKRSAVMAAIVIGGILGGVALGRTFSTSVQDRQSTEPQQKAVSQKEADSPASDPFARTPAWDTFDEMHRLQQDMAKMEHNMRKEMDSVFQRSFQRFGQQPDLLGWSEHSFRQSMNVRDEKDHYVVEVDLPQRDVGNVKVAIEGQMLKVGAEGKKEELQESAGVKKQSEMISSFQQTISLPGPVKADQMKIDRQQGRLVITVPKEVQPRRK